MTICGLCKSSDIVATSQKRNDGNVVYTCNHCGADIYAPVKLRVEKAASVPPLKMEKAPEIVKGDMLPKEMPKKSHHKKN